MKQLKELDQYSKRLSWRNSIISLSLLIVALFILYLESFRSMVSVWLRSETFAHGFLILPISLFLIWRKRSVLANISPRPQVYVFFLILIIEGLWLMADLAGVLTVKQFSVVAMIPALTWLVLGNQVARVIIFPLSYLFFSIPTFDFLVPTLQDFTAEFTVSALRIFAIPVFWEGRFFHIPTGSFEVAEACSGIRYLIACIALGTLFAYLNYVTWPRRLIFVGLAILVPVIANGLRALGIVLLAYYTNQEFGRGIDHIIYGWLFFGLVVFLLFWFGTFIKENKDHTPPSEHSSNSGSKELSNIGKAIPNRFWITAIGISLLIIPPLSASLQSEHNVNKVDYDVELPKGLWSGPYKSEIQWKPVFTGVASEKVAEYRHQQDKVYLYIGCYSYESQDAELINSENRLYDDTVWHRVNDHGENLSLAPNQKWEVNSLTIRSKDKMLLLWYWYEIDRQPVVGKLSAKVRESKMRLLGESNDSYLVVLATPIDFGVDDAKAVLKKYMVDMLSAIRGALQENAPKG